MKAHPGLHAAGAQRALHGFQRVQVRAVARGEGLEHVVVARDQVRARLLLIQNDVAPVRLVVQLVAVRLAAAHAAGAARAAAQCGTTTTPHLHRRPLRAKSTEALSEETMDGFRIDLFRNGRGRTKRR